MSARPVLYGEEFRDLVKNHGINCDYQPAIVCDCISEDSMQPLYNCPKCKGTGFRYLPVQHIKVVATSFDGRVSHDIMSMRESGTAYITPTPSVIMGFHDRLTFPDFRCKYSERIWFTKGSDLSSKLYREAKEVIAIVVDNKQLEPEVDFTVKDNRYIQLTDVAENLFSEDDNWTDNNRLAVSILYYTTPSYIVTDLIHELRSHYTTRKVPVETFEELPKQYRVVREYFDYNLNSDDLKGATLNDNVAHPDNHMANSDGSLYD